MWMALLSAGVWLLHPMQLTSVLYAVQRMTSLSALFVFLGLLGYVYGRRHIQRGENRGFVLMAFSIGAGSVLSIDQAPGDKTHHAVDVLRQRRGQTLERADATFG